MTDDGQVVERDYTYDYHWHGNTPSERIAQLKADLERARAIAVALEQQVARVEALADKFEMESERYLDARSDTLQARADTRYQDAARIRLALDGGQP